MPPKKQTPQWYDLFQPIRAAGRLGCSKLKADPPMLSVQCCFTSTETVRTIRDGEPRTATWIFTQLLGSALLLLSWCFTSTETVWLIRDGRMEVGEEGDYMPIATLSAPE